MSTPSSPARKRRSVVVRVREHPSYPWLAWPIGLGLLALGGVLLYRERAADKTHLIAFGIIAILGLVLVPGVAGYLASSIRQVGAALLPLWRKEASYPPTNADGSDETDV